nr:T9SS C-terminal target domain-containing protein [Flavobacterium sp.]
MKKIYFLLIALCLFTSVNAQNIIFPDANFKTNLLYPNQYGLTEFVNGNFQPILRAVAKDVNRNPIKIDQNNDGQIQVAEALNVYYLDVGFNAGIPQQYYGTDAIITNLSGIEYFTNLKSLICDNNQLSSLDLTQNLTLNELDCSVNQINNLVVSHLPLLRSLKCANNQLINLDVTQNSILTGLYCGYNQISVLDIGTLPNLLDLTCNNNQISALNFNPSVQISQLNCSYNNLTALSLPYSQYVIQSFNCSNNQLTNLDVTNLPWISTLNCSNNQLASLNLGYKRSFYSLDCSGNQLVSITASPDNNTNITCRYNRSTALDVSGVTGITVFDCGDSSTLETLFVKNERGLFIMNFLNTPNLQYICANESDVEEIQQKIAQYGYSNCHVNSYCSFTSGGTFYTIQGNNKLDSDNNGTCDVSDFNLPNLKFNITDGTNTGSVVSNTSGDYSIPVQAGTHTLTPVFENPTYFTVSPTNVVVNFPTQASPFTQNFCVSANGVHPDLEVTILPIVGARPGFDASYRIVYKNKGNIAQSGTINLT